MCAAAGLYVEGRVRIAPPESSHETAVHEELFMCTRSAPLPPDPPPPIPCCLPRSCSALLLLAALMLAHGIGQVHVRMPPNVAAVAQSKSKGLEISGRDSARVRGDTERPHEVVRQHALLLVPNPYTQPRGHISHRQDRRDSREQRRRLVERARVAHSGLWCRAVAAASGRARPRRSHAPRRTGPTCTPAAQLSTRQRSRHQDGLDRLRKRADERRTCCRRPG